MRLSADFDMSNEPLLKSMGALISYMRSFIFHLDTGPISVNSVESFTLDSYMRIDPSVTKSLHIFSEEAHPNIVKGKGRSKEGFSVFGLLDRTRSLCGRKRLKYFSSIRSPPPVSTLSLIAAFLLPLRPLLLCL